MYDIKKAVFVPYCGHIQIEADLHAKAEAIYRKDLERERDELRDEIERLKEFLREFESSAKAALDGYRLTSEDDDG